MTLSTYDYPANRATGSVIALIALIDCAVTGSWVAAFIFAICCVDSSLVRALELWHYQIDKKETGAVR